MRNSYQHIDERISEVLSIEDIPTYGSISWNHNLDEKNYKKHILYSGIFTHQKKVGGTTFPNTFNGEISDIYFTATARKGKKQNLSFIQETVHINELMIELKKCIQHLEKQINDQIPKKNTLETHKSNLSFSIDAFRR